MSGRPRTFAQKALERASHSPRSLEPGEIVDAEPDLYMSHTASWRCIKTLERIPGATLRFPERIAMVMDHISPARTAQTAGHQQLCRQFAQERGCAVLLVEQHVHLALEVADRGYVLSHGEIVLQNDAARLRADRHLLIASYLGEQTEEGGPS